MKRLPIFVIFLLSFLAACSSVPNRSQTPPDWVKGASQKYPGNKYLLGKGSGTSMANAKDLARADLAKNFEVKVLELWRDVQEFEQKQTTEGKQTESSEEIQRTVITSSSQVLHGVEIVDIWQGPESKQVHALAVLDRTKTGNRLRQDIRELDKTTSTAIKQANQADEKLQKAVFAAKALKTQLERRTVQRLLQVVDVSGKGVTEKWELSRLRSDLSELLRRIKIHPSIIDDASGLLAKTLEGALNHAGVLVVAATEADYIMETSLLVEDLGQKDGWYWSRGTLEYKLTDKTGATKAADRWPIKVSAQQQELVAARVGDKATDILNRQLRTSLLQLK